MVSEERVLLTQSRKKQEMQRSSRAQRATPRGHRPEQQGRWQLEARLARLLTAPATALLCVCPRGGTTLTLVTLQLTCLQLHVGGAQSRSEVGVCCDDVLIGRGQMAVKRGKEIDEEKVWNPNSMRTYSVDIFPSQAIVQQKDDRRVEGWHNEGAKFRHETSPLVTAGRTCTF